MNDQLQLCSLFKFKKDSKLYTYIVNKTNEAKTIFTFAEVN